MERRYKFWLETDSGERVLWRSLSERQAREMYNRTRVAHPEGVRQFGWGPHAEPHPDAITRQELDFDCVSGTSMDYLLGVERQLK